MDNEYLFLCVFKNFMAHIYSVDKTQQERLSASPVKYVDTTKCQTGSILRK
jgi:hypothetical protein